MYGAHCRAESRVTLLSCLRFWPNPQHHSLIHLQPFLPPHPPPTLPPNPPTPPPLQGENWKRTTVRTALTFPGVVSTIFLSLNFLVWGQKSSGAAPFGTLCALIFLWFGISVPLCFIGSYFGYKKPAPEVRTCGGVCRRGVKVLLCVCV